MGKIKYTKEIALKIFLDNGYLITGEYKACNKPVEAIHLSCGNSCLATLFVVIKGNPRCRKCTRNSQEKVRDAFLKKGSYLIGNYETASTPVEVKCIKCGTIYFYRYVDICCSKKRNRKNGCPLCDIRRKLTHEEVKSILANSGYEMIGEYTRSNVNIKIKCLKCHTIANTSVNRVRNGHGCANCADYTYKLDQPSLIYLIEHTEIRALKIGIMNSDTERLNQHYSYGWDLVQTWQFETGKESLDFEKEILKWLRNDKKVSPHFNVKSYLSKDGCGHTETAATYDISTDELESYIQNLVGDLCLVPC